MNPSEDEMSFFLGYKWNEEIDGQIWTPGYHTGQVLIYLSNQYLFNAESKRSGF